jgi:hypothetical protein
MCEFGTLTFQYPRLLITASQVDQTLRKEHIRMLEYADPRPGVGPRKVPQGQSPPSDRPPDALVAFNLGLPEWWVEAGEGGAVVG